MFADLDQINTAPGSAPLASSGQGPSSLPPAGAKVSAAEAPLKEEVQHKLHHLPPALLKKCEQARSPVATDASVQTL